MRSYTFLKYCIYIIANGNKTILRMLFNSLTYLIFFPTICIFNWCIPSRYRNVMLLIASYYFYMSREPTFIREASIAYSKLTNTNLGILGGICGVIIALLGGTILSILLHKSKFLRKVLFVEKNIVSYKTAEKR